MGLVPRTTDLELRELPAKHAAVDAALRVDLDEWHEELAFQQEWLDFLGPTVPRAVRLQHELVQEALETAKRVRA